MTDLTAWLDRRAAEREGATGGPWFASDIDVMRSFTVWRVVRGAEGSIEEAVAEVEAPLSTASHIAANDPDTVAAMEAVVRAAAHYRWACGRGTLQADAWVALKAALDALKEVADRG